MKHPIPESAKGNCPYCDAEAGFTTPWGMSPEGWQRMEEAHDAGHPKSTPTKTNKSLVYHAVCLCGKMFSSQDSFSRHLSTCPTVNKGELNPKEDWTVFVGKLIDSRLKAQQEQLLKDFIDRLTEKPGEAGWLRAFNSRLLASLQNELMSLKLLDSRSKGEKT